MIRTHKRVHTDIYGINKWRSTHREHIEIIRTFEGVDTGRDDMNTETSSHRLGWCEHMKDLTQVEMIRTHEGVHSDRDDMNKGKSSLR